MLSIQADKEKRTSSGLIQSCFDNGYLLHIIVITISFPCSFHLKIQNWGERGIYPFLKKSFCTDSLFWQKNQNDEVYAHNALLYGDN